MLAGSKGTSEIADVRVVRRRDIDCLDGRVCTELLERGVDLLDAVLLGEGLGLSLGPVPDTSKLSSGQRKRLCHLVRNHAAPDDSPSELASREDIIREWLVPDFLEGCICRLCRIERLVSLHFRPPFR